MLDVMDNNKWVLAVGRVLLGLIYLIGGLTWLFTLDPPVGALESVGFPLPAVMAWVGLVFKLGGAVLITIGFQTRLGALLLIVFTILTAFLFHPFWVEGEMNTFLKEIAMIGGLLILAAVGPGDLSVEGGKKQPVATPPPMP